ncbi:MAG: YraN family protein [Bdellovibrionota bacterium]
MMLHEQNVVLGKEGEEEAKKYLEARGYVCLDQNHRSGMGEIDLVMEKNGTIVFVEVKSGYTKDNFSPLYRVGFAKQRKLQMLGQEYLMRYNEPKAAQFDVVCVEKEPFDTRIMHYQNVIHAL